MTIENMILRNSNLDAVFLETKMRFEGNEGMIAMRVFEGIRVLQVFESFEGKY